jgi:hypothetical protein
MAKAKIEIDKLEKAASRHIGKAASRKINKMAKAKIEIDKLKKNKKQKQTASREIDKMAKAIVKIVKFENAASREIDKPTKMNTADMTTKILPAKTTSIFSKVVLGLQDAVYYSFSID